MNKMIQQLVRDMAESLATRKLPSIPNRRAALALMKAPAWADGLAARRPYHELESDEQTFGLLAAEGGCLLHASARPAVGVAAQDDRRQNGSNPRLERSIAKKPGR